jgi:hypothetical protein
MKCPTCGTDNKSTNKACFRCGHKLDDNGMQPKGDASSLWFSNAEKKNTPAPPPFWGDSHGKPNYDDSNDFIVLHDESSNSNAAQDLVARGAPVPDNRKKLEGASSKRDVNVIVPPQPAPFIETARGGRRYKIKWPRLVFATIAILVVFAGLGYGAYTIYKVAVNAGSQLIAQKRNTTPMQEPRVDKAIIDGESWHRITFYGQDGDMVLVDNPKRSIAIQNGKAELLLNDQGYIPDDLVKDKVTVSLEATIISPDGKETKITIRPYDIEVPLAPLKIVLPQEQTVSTYNDSILVKIKVTPGSARVMIGGTNVTDNVSADGYASATVKLTANTINSIQISVATAKYRKNVYDLKVERPVMEVPIRLDDATKSSTSGNTVTISGSTDPGVEITTDAKVNGKIDVKASGIFSFTAVLKRWGYNDITITAKTANGRTSKLVHTVNHVPELGSYTSHAQVLDYNYLLSTVDGQIGRVYMIEGLVVKKLESDVSDYYQFNIGKPGETKLLVVEYTKEAGLKQNQFYQLFADVTGSFDNFPVLTVRFLNALPMPSGYGTAPPGGSPAPGGSSTPADSIPPGASKSPEVSANPKA